MISREVPFFDYPRLYLDDKENLLQIVDEVASKGAYILQKDVAEFENKLATYTGSNHSIGVANATDGLEIAWMGIGLNPGDEVICCAHTMLATASAIRMAGGTPVPVDIGTDNLINPDAVEDAINSKTVGIMPTQLNGRTCDMDSLMNIALKNNLKVVEDAAQALGSRYKGKHAGTFGDASAISFFPAKLLGCFGDAGAVLTNNKELYHKFYQLHDHGRDVNGDVVSWGRNSRLDNIQAAILNYKMNSYQDVINRRRDIARQYQDYLADVTEIKLPPGPDDHSDHFDVYQNYEITALYRDDLKEYLYQNGIGTLIQWGGKALTQWDVLGLSKKLPNVEAFFEQCIMLPMNMFIDDSDIEYICDKVKAFYANRYVQ